MSSKKILYLYVNYNFIASNLRFASFANLKYSRIEKILRKIILEYRDQFFYI